MIILIYGSKGWIGKQFIELLKSKRINYKEGYSRADNELEVRKEISKYKPTHIISFIGRTHGKDCSTIDYLESKDKLIENVRDNLYSPFVLAQLAKEFSIHYTYLGTGCIFKYEGDKKFTEEDQANFFGSSYSVVKGFTDRMMKFYKVLNLRIRMPIVSEYHPRNFITKITSYEKICSIPNSMTVLDELLPYVIKMMERNIIGTLNLTNPGVISHNEILEMYKELVDEDFTYQNFTQEEQLAILKADRSNNHMDCSRLISLFPEIKHIKDSVRACLEKYRRPNNILITGGCGFIGSNFINYYFGKDNFNQMICLDAMYYCASKDNIDQSILNHPNFVMIEGKCQDEILVKEILRKYHITHVYHFAAQSHVTSSFEESLKYTDDNILGTHILLEKCRQWNKIKKFIHVSTDEVYGDKMTEKRIEQNILCPTNPYAATKAGAELIVQSYYHSFNMPIIITRANNIYGPNQYPEKVIPKFIDSLRKDQKITIEGNGEQTRGFLYAEDACRAFELIMMKGLIGEIYNIGSDEEYSINYVAETIINKMNKSKEFIVYIEDRPYNDKRYHISNQKIKSLGWEIKTNFEEGLAKIIS